MGAFLDRWQKVFVRLTAIPIVFLGVGIYRAWLATFFRYGVVPTITFSDYVIFEGAIGVVSLLLAFFARRVIPLWSNNRATALSLIGMVGGAALCVIDCFALQTGFLKYLGLAAAGAGLAILILMWAEFYGSLNPMRVALYHAAAIFFGELIKCLFAGLSAPYLIFFSLVLPFISVLWVRKSMLRLPLVDHPQKTRESAVRVFPWKPVLLMSICTFAIGFGMMPQQPLLAGNIIGTLFVTALVFFGVLSASRWFNFDTIYQLAFPLIIVCFLLIAPSIPGSPEVMAFCFDAGYTMLSMFIMLILSNITYRFGISAVWISGIERGVRYIAESIGWTVFVFASTSLTVSTFTTVYSGITIALILMFILVFFTERGLSAEWGITIKTDEGEEQLSLGQQAHRVYELSKQHNLSPREEEVLQLLARKKTVLQMEDELYLAEGTIKAHVSHIYRKLNVHSRAELHNLLNTPE